MELPAGGDNTAGPSAPPTTKLLKSCEACRASKSKCLAHEDPHIHSCQRCTKLGKSCTFMHAQPRPKRGKQPKRGGRVAVVEKKVDDIHALLRSLQQSGGTGSISDSLEYESLEAARRHASPPSLAPTRSEQSMSTEPTPASTQQHEVSTDVFSKGILTIEQGATLLAQFKQMEYYYPLIQVIKISDVHHMRTSHPFLLLSALLSASYRHLWSRHWILEREFREELARRVIVEGEKSLDLLQSLLLNVAWYHHHYQPRNQQLYQLTCLCASMAVDLGLHKSIKRPQHLHHNIPIDPDSPNAPMSILGLEERRTSIATYLLCSSIRRPNFFPYSDYLEDCCQSLAMNPELQSDPQLVHLVKLQRLAEEANDTFGYGSRSVPSWMGLFPDSRQPDVHIGAELLMHHVKGFEARLDAVRRNMPPPGSCSISLMMAYHAASISTHEISLHTLQQQASPGSSFTVTGAAAFSSPAGPAAASSSSTNTSPASNLTPAAAAPSTSTSNSTTTSSSPPAPLPLDSPIATTLLTLLTNTQATLSYFLSIPATTLPDLTLPDIMRATYAIIVTGKLFLNPTLNAALVRLGTDTKLPQYLDAFTDHLAKLIKVDDSGAELQDAFWYFRKIVIRMREWYDARSAGRPGGGGSSGGGGVDAGAAAATGSGVGGSGVGVGGTGGSNHELGADIESHINATLKRDVLTPGRPMTRGGVATAGTPVEHQNQYHHHQQQQQQQQQHQHQQQQQPEVATARDWEVGMEDAPWPPDEGFWQEMLLHWPADMLTMDAAMQFEDRGGGGGGGQGMDGSGNGGGGMGSGLGMGWM